MNAFMHHALHNTYWTPLGLALSGIEIFDHQNSSLANF